MKIEENVWDWHRVLEESTPWCLWRWTSECGGRCREREAPSATAILSTSLSPWKEEPSRAAPTPPPFSRFNSIQKSQFANTNTSLGWVRVLFIVLRIRFVALCVTHNKDSNTRRRKRRIEEKPLSVFTAASLPNQGFK